MNRSNLGWPIVALTILSLSLASAVFLSAGVWPADMQPTLLGVSLASLSYWIFASHHNSCPAVPNSLLWLILAFLSYLIFQLVPLPLSILNLLSPERAELFKQLPDYFPIGLHAAPLSANAPRSILYLTTFFSGTATFFLTRDLAWRFYPRIWVVTIPLIAIATLEAILGILQALRAMSETEASGTYTNRDHFSGLLEMILPLVAVYGLALFKKRSQRTLSFLTAAAAALLWSVAALIGVAIAYSLSRTGFLVGIAATLFSCALCIMPPSPTRAQTIASFALFGLFLLLTLVFFPPVQLLERFAEISSAGAISSNARLTLWKDSLPLISHYLYFGTGLGGYESVFLKYQSANNGYLVQFAHNDYLQYLSELGVIGTSILAAACAAVLVQTVRGISRNSDLDSRLLSVACAGSFMAIGLHSLVDFNTYIPANAMVLAWIAGIASLGPIA